MTRSLSMAHGSSPPSPPRAHERHAARGTRHAARGTHNTHARTHANARTQTQTHARKRKHTFSHARSIHAPWHTPLNPHTTSKPPRVHVRTRMLAQMRAHARNTRARAQRCLQLRRTLHHFFYRTSRARSVHCSRRRTNFSPMSVLQPLPLSLPSATSSGLHSAQASESKLQHGSTNVPVAHLSWTCTFARRRTPT